MRTVAGMAAVFMVTGRIVGTPGAAPNFTSNLASNSGMDDDNNKRVDARLTELEIKASFTEDLVDQLNQVVVRQQQQIDLLMREIARLQEQAPEAGAAPAFRSLREDLPPHY